MLLLDLFIILKKLDGEYEQKWHEVSLILLD